MQNLSKNDYKQFTHLERINLTMAALARGDIEEANRCWDTCPRHDYKAMDFEYTIRMHGVLMLRMEFREKCFYHYNKIKLIEARMLHLECFIDSENFEDRMNTLDEVHVASIARLKAVYEALKQVCCGVGLCPDVFLENCHIEEHCPDMDSYLSADAQLDDKYVESYKQIFSIYWKA